MILSIWFHLHGPFPVPGSCLPGAEAGECHRWNSAYGFIVLLGDYSMVADQNPCSNEFG